MRFWCIILYVTIFLVSPSYAEDSVPESVDPELYTEDIQRIEAYLSGFDTLKTRFRQTAPGQGTISQGKLYLSRPGKARWEYQDPIKLSLYINDDDLIYYDHELDQITYGDVPDTPLRFLLNKEHNLSDHFTVKSLMDFEHSISITITPQNLEKGDFQSLTLIFSKKPLELRKIYNTDSNNQTSTIELIQPDFNVTLNDDVFEFKNPRIFERNKH